MPTRADLELARPLCHNGIWTKIAGKIHGQTISCYTPLRYFHETNLWRCPCCNHAIPGAVIAGRTIDLELTA